MRPPEPAPARESWGLRPGVVFLNHGSFGACPLPILKLQARLQRQMEADPVQFLWRRLDALLEPSRRVLARFVGANPEDLAFVTNATTGVNAVVRSLPWRPGDELLTTNLDYNACRNVLAETARRYRARVVVAPIPFPLRSADDIVAAVLEAVTPRTRLAMLDHVTSDTALVLPIARLIRELDHRGVDTLVDGAHAPGMLPLDLARLRPAYYTGNLHKWVAAPKGAAFLWVRADRQARVLPPVISHGYNRPRPGFTRFQDHFDWTGTFDPSAWLCVGEAITWMGARLPGGWTELRRRNHALAVQARHLLARRLRVEPPCPAPLLGSMATLPLPKEFQSSPRTGKIDREQLRLYDEFHIEVPLTRFGQPERRWFRVSAHIYNHLPEYEYLADALARVCSRGR